MGKKKMSAVYCSFCATANMDGAQKCASCGRDLPSSDEKQSIAKAQNKKRWWQYVVSRIGASDFTNTSGM